MDQLKNFANKLGSSSKTDTTGTGAPAGNTAAPVEGGAAPVQGTTGTAGKEDYLDKGFDAVGKKFGYSGNRETNEKITDFARGKFETATGKKVPEKFSN